MKRLFPIVLALLIPFVLFAQAPQGKKAELLKSFKLSDVQVTQVNDIEQTTRDLVKNDLVHLQLANAEIKDLLLTTDKPDLPAIYKLVDKKAQLRVEMEKALIAARVQLTQIMGKDNFDKYFRLIRAEMRESFSGRMGPGMGRMGPEDGPRDE